MGLLVAAAATATICLLLLPIAATVFSSVRGPTLPFGVPSALWTLSNYAELMTLGGGLLETIVVTTIFVGGSSLFAMSTAWILAWLVVRTDLPARPLIAALIIVPFIIPPIVRAQSYILMLAPESGAMNQLLRLLPWWAGDRGPIDPFALGSIIAIQGLGSVTFPFLLLLPILQNMDNSLEEAGRMAGASFPQTFRRVTFPVLWPPTLGLTILLVILQLGSLEIPLIFGQRDGGAIFAMRLWDLVTPGAGELPKYGIAAAYGVVFLVLTTIVFRLYVRATRDAERRATITGKGFRPTRIALRRWRAPALIIVALYLVPAVVLPGVSLVWASITPYPVPMTIQNARDLLTLEPLSAVIGDPEFWASLGRSIVIAGLSATIAVAIAIVLAHRVARGGPGFRTRALDALASSSIALPSIIVAFAGYILFLVVNRWVGLLGTIWALVLLYSHRISVAYRTSFASVRQIGLELEESAVASGANSLQTFRRIVLPLVLPAGFAVWIQLFILGAHEFTLPSFLVTPQNRPLSWYLFAKINPQDGAYYAPSQGAAMGLIFTIAFFVIGLALRLLIGRLSIQNPASRSGKSGRTNDEEPLPE